MALRMTPSLLEVFENLQQAGAAGVDESEFVSLHIFEAHGLAECFDLVDRRYRLTDIGQRMADFLFGEKDDEQRCRVRKAV